MSSSLPDPSPVSEEADTAVASDARWSLPGAGKSLPVTADYVPANPLDGPSDAAIPVSMPPPVVQIVVERGGRACHSLGIASMALGSLAFLICWIPLLGMLGMPLNALGTLLGLGGFVVAVVRGGSGIGFPAAGASICILALAVAYKLTGGFR